MLHKRAINDDDIDPDDALFTIPTTTTTTTTTEPPPPTPSFNPFGNDYDQQQQLNLAQSILRTRIYSTTENTSSHLLI